MVKNEEPRTKNQEPRAGRRLTVGSWFLVLGSWFLVAADSPGPVVVDLQPRATASGRTVTLGDVANLQGGSDILRARLAQLDVAEFTTSAAPVVVKRAQVEYRLRLADVPSSLFQLTGAKEVTAAPQRSFVSEDRLVAAARAALLRRLPWAAEDVSVRPLQTPAIPLPTLADPDDMNFTAEPHTPGVLTGRVQMDVSVYVRGERRLSLPVYLEVKPLQKVAICRQRVEKGEALTEANVFVERRPADAGPAAVAADTAIGRRAKRALVPGHVVGATDIEDMVSEGTVVIKARQLVKMIVRLGAVNVVASGEAQQDGRLGQMIRVLNVESKKIVTGRVTGPDTVEFDRGGVP